MREGRRRRLGLLTGTEGTVGDTYLDRILGDVDVAGEPNILSLDPDANVRTTDQRYVSDAYNYYLGGGYDAAQDDFPIQAEDITGGQILDTSGDNQALATSGVGIGGDTPPITNMPTDYEAEAYGAPDTIESLTDPTVEQTLASEDIGAIEGLGPPISLDISSNLLIIFSEGK